REPPPRRPYAPRRPEGRLSPGPLVFPLDREPRSTTGRDAERRRAANARPRPRVHAAPAADAARRAVSRPGADRRLGDLPDREGAERARRIDRPRSRAEREHRAPSREHGVRARGRPCRALRGQRRASEGRVGAEELPRLLMVAARVSRRLYLRDLWAPRASAPISLPVGLMLVSACVFLTVGS